MEGINDIFIQNTSGIPYIARCYGGNYCQTQPDHELVTGFFAAINSFKGELGQRELNNVVYDQINLIFENKGDLLVVCNLDSEVNEEQFRKVAVKLEEEFLKRYGESRGSGELDVVPGQDFSSYIEWMDSVVGNGMADLRPLMGSQSKGILAKLKSWLI